VHVMAHTGKQGSTLCADCFGQRIETPMQSQRPALTPAVADVSLEQRVRDAILATTLRNGQANDAGPGNEHVHGMLVWH
jgi:hypothetical protein